MNTLRKLRSPWVVVTLLLGSYVAVSEYILVEVIDGSDPSLSKLNIRRFKHKWMADFYRPMIYFDSKVRGETVSAWYDVRRRPRPLRKNAVPIDGDHD